MYFKQKDCSNVEPFIDKLIYANSKEELGGKVLDIYLSHPYWNSDQSGLTEDKLFIRILAVDTGKPLEEQVAKWKVNRCIDWYSVTKELDFCHFHGMRYKNHLHGMNRPRDRDPVDPSGAVWYSKFRMTGDIWIKLETLKRNVTQTR